jgi:hypothetical protein
MGSRGTYSLSPTDSTARLWFCVKGSASQPAIWREVLLGPEFIGTG